MLCREDLCVSSRGLTLLCVSILGKAWIISSLRNFLGSVLRATSRLHHSVTSDSFVFFGSAEVSVHKEEKERGEVLFNLKQRSLNSVSEARSNDLSSDSISAIPLQPFP